MSDTVVDIAVTEIRPDPKNLRQSFDADEISALADNIREIGQMDPIQVFSREDGTYDLFDGERRWRAARLAGLEWLKAIVIPRPSDSELLVKKVSRTMQTKTLSFSEEVGALEEGLRALECLDVPSEWSMAAKKLGVPLGVLRERMRVRRLSRKLRQSFEEGELDYTIAQSLGRIEDVIRQEQLAAFIEDSKLSNRFVTTKYIQAALENPSASPLEVYEIARQAERFRYAEPRKEEVPASTVDQLDTILRDIRRVQGWLETVSRNDFLVELQESTFNTRRFFTSLIRLRGMVDAFVRVHTPGDAEEPLRSELERGQSSDPPLVGLLNPGQGASPDDASPGPQT